MDESMMRYPHSDHRLRAGARAERRLASPTADLDLLRAEMALKRALVRLDLRD